MNSELSSFAARLRGLFFAGDDLGSLCSITGRNEPAHVDAGKSNFESFALELFALQFKLNPAYRKICEARKLTPQAVGHWTQIPAVPTSAFKELELTSIPTDDRTAAFHSSGTTEQKPSHHFHSAESLAVYETSLWPWFEMNVLRAAGRSSASSAKAREPAVRAPIFLTPAPTQVPHSSLVHMFGVVQQKLTGAAAPTDRSPFFGKLDDDSAWTLDFDAVIDALSAEGDEVLRSSLFLLGTAFSFVHLLDYLGENHLRFALPAGSRVMETGGYKNRSRTMPRDELHALITERLGIPRENIICEYGMSELSSQAYAGADGKFKFPPWARVQIVSPETGREVADGETGLVRIFDLANVYSVAAVQTEDLGIRRGDGFELIGRAHLAEPRGCSLMTA